MKLKIHGGVGEKGRTCIGVEEAGTRLLLDAGVDTSAPRSPAYYPAITPAELGQIEGARLLGNDARDRLRADGFTDQEIDEWAETYVAENGGGEVDEFVAWIGEQEHRGA